MWHVKAAALCTLIALASGVPMDKARPKIDDSIMALSELPMLTDVEIPAEIDAEPTPPAAVMTPPRRQVAYDQRQEGHYNIRADLENFVILVVPSSATSGASLLELLTRAHGQKRNKHAQKKYHAQSDKFEEKKTATGKLDYLKLRPAEPVEVAEQPRIVDEFIEGRTPYRVDISSTADLLQPVPVVSVAQQQAPVAIKGNIVVEPETSSHLLLPSRSNRYRKSLTEGNGNINTNSVVLTPLAHDTHRSRSSDAIDATDIDPILNAADVADGGAGDTDDDRRYQAVDANEQQMLGNPTLIDLTDLNHSFDSVNIGNLDLAAGSANGGSNDQWQLELLGAQEQCGPDRRRDSYGVCQFVPPDYAP